MRKVTVRDLTHAPTETPWKYKDFCARAAEEVKRCGVYIHEEPMVRPPGPFRLHPSAKAAGETSDFPAKLQAAIHTPRLHAHSRPGTSRTTGSESGSPRASRTSSRGASRPTYERCPRGSLDWVESLPDFH
eukprot:symbB.v1.2.016891.t1/scaffold1299.1/size126157/13